MRLLLKARLRQWIHCLLHLHGPASYKSTTKKGTTRALYCWGCDEVFYDDVKEEQ